jgi:hypothetical protein
LEEDDKLLAQAGFVPLDKFFSDLGSKALALDQQLLELEFQLDLEKKDFRRDFENIASGHIVDFSLRLKNILALARLSHSIADSRAALFIVAGEAETQELKLAQELGSKRGRGRRKGPLPFLVNELELGARCANGGFTLDKKLRKGTLIQALDFLRARFLAEPKWSWVADFLPLPGHHPVSTYEYSIAEARAHHPVSTYERSTAEARAKYERSIAEARAHHPVSTHERLIAEARARYEIR